MPRLARLTLIGVGTVAAVGLVTLLITLEGFDWGALGAMATTAGAVFAWRAAKASERTGRNAMMTLAAAIQPEVECRWVREASIVNTGTWDAVDLQVEFVFATGEKTHHTRDLLVGGRPRRGEAPGYGGAEVVTYPPEAMWKPLEDLDPSSIDRATVWYWDAHRLSRYRLEAWYEGSKLMRRVRAISGPQPRNDA